MTHGACQSGPQNRASQPRAAVTAAHGAPARRGRADARDCLISPRQAYRYLEEASQLTAPVPVGDEKIAFTVKLSRGLVAQVRSYARIKRLSLSELVSRALRVWLRRR
jgi:hypothetical protein